MTRVKPFVIGDVIAGRYRLDSLLGKGAMGAVYQATQLSLQRKIAIKLMLPEFSMDDEYRARFEREARTTSMMKHPNAVEVYDFGEFEGFLFLAMELLSGVPLRKILKEGQLTQRHILSIALQVVEVLIAAHDLSLVHRDLKPENIMLEARSDGTERAVVVDFGLAFVSTNNDEIGRMTASNAVLGTPQYIAPEQARAGEIGPPIDVYSFGCILFEMFTGRPPFVHTRVIDLMTSHVYKPAPAAREFAPQLPKQLDDLLSAMLQKKPEQRPTAREVKEELSTLTGENAGRPHTREASFLSRKRQELPPIDHAHSDTIQLKIPESVQFRVAIFGEKAPVDIITVLNIAALPIKLFDTTDADLSDCQVVLVPKATPEIVTRLLPFQLPIVATIEVGAEDDDKRASALQSLGVFDCAVEPIESASLLKKLASAVKKAQRLNKRSK